MYVLACRELYKQARLIFRIPSATQVMCMALQREAGSAASELPERALVRDAQSTIPRALLGREMEDEAYAIGLTVDQLAEVAMLLNATADFHFLQRCGQNTEVRAKMG